MPKAIHVLRKFEPAEWGGVETHMVGLIPELGRLGWEVEVHAPAETGTDGRALVAAGASFRTFRARYPYLGMTARRRAGLVATGGNLVSVQELARLLTDRSAAVLHVHTLGRLGGAVRTAARLTARPYAATLHGPTRVGVEPALAEAARRTRGMLDVGAPFGWAVGARRVVRDADAVFVLNRRERDAWLPGRRGRHLEVLAHGVDPARATAERRAEARASVPGLCGSSFAVLVGRLDPLKGQRLAIEAFVGAAPAGLHLVLAGASTDAAYAREVIEAARAAGSRVHVLGGVSPLEARALLAEAALALVPSVTEPFGIVLLEAWAEGTPALFSDVGGLGETAREAGATWGAVAVRDACGWAARIRAALADEAGLESERRLGPERVSRGYTWASAARRTAAAYRGALLGRARA
jgi:glycosyltransferase involved in cell wall biosynthesis